MKKRKKKTRDKNPCAGCEWGYELNEQQVYGPASLRNFFPQKKHSTMATPS